MKKHDDAGAIPLASRHLDEQVNPSRFRDMMSLFPTGVSVVTSTDREGRPRGATCSSLSSVTLTPPTLLICLQEGGSTLDAIQSSGRFAVNLLRVGAQRAAEVFSSPLVDRFTEVPWAAWNPSKLPYLYRDAIGIADCRVTYQIRIGDHIIVVGTVSDLFISAGLPLLYGLRSYSSWPAEMNEYVISQQYD
jgi:flavin reductase (NADH)